MKPGAKGWGTLESEELSNLGAFFSMILPAIVLLLLSILALGTLVNLALLGTVPTANSGLSKDIFSSGNVRISRTLFHGGKPVSIPESPPALSFLRKKLQPWENADLNRVLSLVMRTTYDEDEDGEADEEVGYFSTEEVLMGLENPDKSLEEQENEGKRINPKRKPRDESADAASPSGTFKPPKIRTLSEINLLMPSWFLGMVSNQRFVFTKVDRPGLVGVPLDYYTIPSFYTSPRPRNPHDITLVTQCSLSRLESIIDIGRTWNGVISLAVYVQHPLTVPFLPDILIAFAQEVESVNPKVRLDISLLFGARFSLTSTNILGATVRAGVTGKSGMDVDSINGIRERTQQPPVTPSQQQQQQQQQQQENLASSFSLIKEVHPYDFAYPVNALRNLALDNAHTEFVINTDCDFLPSKDMHELLASNTIYSFMQAQSKWQVAAFVIPVFEMLSNHTALPVPFTRTHLDEFCSRSLIVPFHSRFSLPKDAMDVGKVTDWCLGKNKLPYHVGINDIQGPTNYPRWFTATEPYPVNLSKGKLNRYYEPYMVSKKALLPRFEERFRGYSFNKRAQMIELQYAQFDLFTLPYVFMTHRYHGNSIGKQMMEGSKVFRETVKRTYEDFILQVRLRYPPSYGSKKLLNSLYLTEFFH